MNLGLVLVAVDAFIRSTHLSSSKVTNSHWPGDISKVFLACLAETLAFHFGVTISCWALLKMRPLFVGRPPSSPSSGIHDEFRLVLIPLTLLYSSITKLFLLLLLSVWYSPVQKSITPQLNSKVTSALSKLENHPTRMAVGLIVHMFDDDVFDRKWVARNILGGMSAGFGLRVVLDTHPTITTLAILGGWAAKTFIGKVLSGWVGRGEEWVGWSIP